jgi:hypothetical protein
VADVAMSLRLPYDMAEDLRIVAGVDGQSMTEAIRIAVDRHLAGRKADPAFRAALTRHVERQQRLLTELAETAATPREVGP